MFTLYRKFKVGCIISIQSISQLELHGQKENYKSLVLSNCTNKIFTGSAEYSECEYWCNEFGTHREWTYTNSIDTEKVKYDPKYGGVKWAYVTTIPIGKLQALTLKKCGYRILGDGGFLQAGVGLFDFLPAKYKEPQKLKTFDFGKYSDGVTTSTEDANNGSHQKKFDLKNIDFKDEKDEFNPIQTDATDSKYLFNNEDAIIVNFKKGNPNQ